MTPPPVRLPDLVRVRQRFRSRPEVDVVARLDEQLDSAGLAGRRAPGARVELADGGLTPAWGWSRGGDV